MARRAGLAGVGTTELRRELERRRRRLPKLARMRAELLGRVAEIDRVMATLKADGGPTGLRTRHRNEMSLVEALYKTLDGSRMSVTEAVAAVQRAGYRTTAVNFRTIVNQTLINSGKFKRLERGVYTAK